MLDTRLQTQFARSCTVAALSCASAATATYAAAMTRGFDFWMASMRPVATPAPFGLLPYRPPQRSTYVVSPGWPPMPAFTDWAMPFGHTPVNPLAAWLEFLPVRGPATAWPMAFMLISCGIPRSIAWPAAEANASAMEAAEIAGKAINQVFSSYRSDGGHAVAQIMAPSPAANAAALMMAAPLAFMAMAPLLTAVSTA